MNYLIQITGTNIWIQKNDSTGRVIKENTMYANTMAIPYSGPAYDRLHVKESSDSRRIILDIPMSMCVIDTGIDYHQAR